MAAEPKVSQCLMEEGTVIFLRALAGVSDEALASPTGLTGWTGRHVVAHVAANADALVNLALWARTGQETPMYSSPGRRNADIEAGAMQPVGHLRAWVAASADKLSDALGELTPEQWAAQVRTAQGRMVPASEVPWMRTREVMVHAVDLGGQIRFADLPVDFHAALLDDITAKRSGAADGPALTLVPTDADRTWSVIGAGDTTTVRGALAELTAYLAGRQAERLRAEGTDVPELPRWL